MHRTQLIEQIRSKQSFLCVGLDTDLNKIPDFLLDKQDPVFEFNRQIIDATRDLCIAYKPNSAFYECRGVAGWQSLVNTWQYIPKDCLSIADAKRGDIGNTSEMYAQAFFDRENSGMAFDAITVSPYMGNDSVSPFLKFKDRWIIILALTSNHGSKDFQLITDNNEYFFEKVIRKSSFWGTEGNIMYVVGATQGESFLTIRKHAPNHFLLVPGVGAQGGSLQDVCRYGLNKDCGLIVNASRSILYASGGSNFAEAARAEALKMQQEMQAELEKIGF